MKGGLAALIALALTTVTVAAAVPAPTAQGLDLEAPDAFLATAEGLVQAAEGGSAVAALQAVLAAQGFHDVPLAVEGGAPEGAPAELAAPLARLLAAATVAEQLRAAAVAPLSAEEQAFVLEQGLWIAPALEAPEAASIDGAAETALPGTAAWTLAPGAAELLAKVDPAPFRVAGLTVLAALEQSAPELRLAALRGGAGIASHCGVTGTIRFETNGCEVVVGDTGPNTWTSGTIRVAVDLGGDDAYLGGATALAKSNVRLLVDVAGRDGYTVAATASGAGTGALAEGIALGALGVAVLADLGGDDRYTATSTTTAGQPGGAAGAARVTAQGVANIGAGIVLDAGGRDTFTASATSSGGPASIQAQGQAAVGLGAVLNLGSEAGPDDTYTVLPTSTLHITSRTAQLTEYTIGAVDAATQGAADLGGAAVLVDAGGDDTYTAQLVGAFATLSAQGAGEGGAGALVDAQGHDTLVARALGDTTLSFLVNNGSANTCWTVTVTVGVGESKAFGQGAGSPGAGLLVDGTGNDRRLLEAHSHAGALGGITTTFDCTPFGLTQRITTTATSGAGTAEGQGSAATGAGVLVDLAGNDRNELQGRSTALASSIFNGPGSRIESATSTAGQARIFGQAESRTGIAVLADAGGSDQYLGGTLSSATRTTGAGGTTITPGPEVRSIQAFGNGGVAWLLDLGGTDNYTNPSAGNNRCWSSGPSGGRGRDYADAVAVVLTPGCP